ncbi:hypothetical protein PRUPE_6G289500 [Prunus persica]|uniref:Uncharacterized protein n=1 Tax=Prunus persica TaxID=3760 RepID=A0A251NX75_PRUPE|nr:hypothetical protein PRUPE_6G289500 [Prunus persica]
MTFPQWRPQQYTPTRDLFGNFLEFGIRWKHFVVRGKPNPEWGLISSSGVGTPYGIYHFFFVVKTHVLNMKSIYVMFASKKNMYFTNIK